MKKLFWGLLGLIPACLWAQPAGLAGGSSSADARTIPISVSYFGNWGTHPGLKVEGEWLWAISSTSKQKNERVKIRRKEVFSGLSVAGYAHPGTQFGLIPGLNLGGRLLGGKGGFGEVSIGANYYALFNQGETWELDEQGNAVNLGQTARGYFAPSLSLGGGKAFGLSDHMSAGLFARVNSHFLMDYNTGILPQLSLEIGIRLLPGLKLPLTSNFLQP